MCAQLCPILCGPMNCSLPGSSVHGIFQSRILEWVVISSSRPSSQLRDQTCISCVSSIGRWILYYWNTREAPNFKMNLLQKWEPATFYFKGAWLLCLGGGCDLCMQIQITWRTFIYAEWTVSEAHFYNLCITIFQWNMLIHTLLHLTLITANETVYCR